jgi:hypothetical protein
MQINYITGPSPVRSGFGACQFSFVSCLEGTLVRTSFPSDEDVRHAANSHVADTYKMDELTANRDYLRGLCLKIAY